MISNGFDTDKVLTALTGRIGWRQPSGSPTLDDDNKGSKSGRYFQDFHSAVTVKNLYDTMDEVGANDADFNAYIKSLQQSVIIEALNAVFIKPQLVESALLFERGIYAPQPVKNDGNFVGFQIRVAPGAYSVQLNTVTLNFDKDATFSLYLYNEGRLAPIWSQEVIAVANDEAIIDLTECVFRHTSPDNKGGLFYFGYFQDDIGDAQAIEQNFFSWNEGKIYEALSFESKANGQSFDKDEIFSNYRNYGLNLELNVFRDYTKAIVQNAYLFDELVGLYMASKVMEGIVFSERSNKTQRLSADNTAQIYTDLNTAMPTEERPFNVGIKTRITRELKKVYNNFFPPAKIKTTAPSC